MWSKTIFNVRTPQYKYMRSVYVPVNTENPWYLLNSAKALAAVEKFVKSDSYGNGVSLYGPGEMLYSDFGKNPISRAETVENYRAMFAALGERPAVVNSGNAYTYPYADKIYALPTSSDGNVLFSRSVPFVQMVLHGYLSYGAESGDDLLDCIAFGAAPRVQRHRDRRFPADGNQLQLAVRQQLCQLGAAGQGQLCGLQ